MSVFIKTGPANLSGLIEPRGGDRRKTLTVTDSYEADECSSGLF